MRLSQLFSPARSARAAVIAQPSEQPAIPDVGGTGESAVKPHDSELDLFGITHPGKVRSENQDHFMICTVHPQVIVHGSSVPHADRLPLRGQRLASMFLVADGVGGQAGGAEASRLTAEAITAYVSSSLRCYHTAGTSQDQEFHDALLAAALKAHETVSVESAIRGDTKMATTLTVAIAVWPWLYVLQVGDSRAYFFCDDKLRQLTRDQTVAQELVDQGILRPERAAGSPYQHVLSSAIGGSTALPVVSRIDVRGSNPLLLLCSDGLTKHVSDDEIEREIRRLQSSEQLCRSLLDLALSRGGMDNITLVTARANRAASVS